MPHQSQHQGWHYWHGARTRVPAGRMQSVREARWASTSAKWAGNAADVDEASAAALHLLPAVALGGDSFDQLGTQPIEADTKVAALHAQPLYGHPCGGRRQLHLRRGIPHTRQRYPRGEQLASTLGPTAPALHQTTLRTEGRYPQSHLQRRYCASVASDRRRHGSCASVTMDQEYAGRAGHPSAGDRMRVVGGSRRAAHKWTDIEGNKDTKEAYLHETPGEADDGTLRHANLCSGTGAFSMAMRQLGASTVWAIDIVLNATDIYNESNDQHKTATGDLCDLELWCGWKWINSVGAIGAPCQSFSGAYAGAAGFDDPRGRLLAWAVLWIALNEPKLMVIEHVRGLLKKPNADNLDIIGLVERHRIRQVHPGRRSGLGPRTEQGTSLHHFRGGAD